MPYALTRYDVEHYEVLKRTPPRTTTCCRSPEFGQLSGRAQRAQAGRGRQLEQHGLNMHTQTPDCGFAQLHVRTSASTGVGLGQARRLYDRQATLVLPMVLGCEASTALPTSTPSSHGARRRSGCSTPWWPRCGPPQTGGCGRSSSSRPTRGEVNPASDSAWLDLQRAAVHRLRARGGRRAAAAAGRRRSRLRWGVLAPAPRGRRAARTDAPGAGAASMPGPARPRDAPSTCARSMR